MMGGRAGPSECCEGRLGYGLLVHYHAPPCNTRLRCISCVLDARPTPLSALLTRAAARPHSLHSSFRTLQSAHLLQYKKQRRLPLVLPICWS